MSSESWYEVKISTNSDVFEEEEEKPYLQRRGEHIGSFWQDITTTFIILDIVNGVQNIDNVKVLTIEQEIGSIQKFSSVEEANK